LPLLESSLERLGDAVPAGVIAGARGDHYFLHPETKNDPKHKAFIAKFKAKTGAYPIYSTYHMAQALVGLKQAMKKPSRPMAANGPAPSKWLKRCAPWNSKLMVDLCACARMGKVWKINC